jgi:alkanesulfonate monooxygenase SsuD/methylene tetrahydromethanopterin reductase-like flavin-dependent oxidoreductase (luciferase family)
MPRGEGEQQGVLHGDRGLDVLPKPPGATIPLAIAGQARQSAEWIAQNADASLDCPRDLSAPRLKIRQWRQLTEGAPSRT